MSSITLEKLQGVYDIRYQSTPVQPEWFESGIGMAEIKGTHLSGMDGIGVKWDADFEFIEGGELEFSAVLDPKDTPPNGGLIDKNGNMTKDIQTYQGKLVVVNIGDKVILKTVVQQGPLTIDVQFQKRP